MSGKLISIKNHVHDFTDDLESTIYILLWVALMYSECSDRGRGAGSLITILDPEPDTNRTYVLKSQFLTAAALSGEYLQGFNFPGRPCLDTLLNRLTKLFARRYLPDPSAEQRATQATIKKLMLGNDPDLKKVYDEHPATVHDQEVEHLKNHDETIRFFEEALANCDSWPVDDKAVYQNIPDHPLQSLGPQRARKTNLSTTLFTWDGADSKEIVVITM